MTGGRSLASVLVVLLVMAVLLSACGGSKQPAQTSDSGASGAAVSTAASGAVSGAKPAAPAAASSSGSSGSTADALPTLDTARLVIRNGELDLTVKTLGDSLAAVRQIASDAGGLVFSSSTSSSGSQPNATVTLQVPAERFDEVMTSLRSMTGVTDVGRENVTSQDVTDEYVDLQARQRNLQATEQQYLTLLTKATTISDTLAVEQQLSRVQGDLEQVEGRIKFLDQRTSYSRITVTIHGVVAAAQTGETSLSHTALLAWQRSLRFVVSVARAAITVVVFLWWFWPLLAAGLYILRRRQHANRAAEGIGS